MKASVLLALCAAILVGCAKEPFKVADSAVVYADAYRETKVEPWGRMAAADLARILSLVTGSAVKAYPESEWNSAVRPSTSTSNLITYRLSIPWSEIPGVAPGKGASFGCNLVLGDSDGDEKFGRFLWGGGLKDDSADCGLVTLIK